MNKQLLKAKKKRNDEFYTQLIDIEIELENYKEYIKDKVIYCNCDDPRYSHFVEYFLINFNRLKLKKLIATCYQPSQIDFFDTYQDSLIPLYLESDGYSKNIDQLRGNGDFRSEECIEILKKSDIVITNPPFSLFREYVDQLMRFDKKFIILGNLNVITYKNIFDFFKSKRFNFGFNKNNKKWFEVSIDYDICQANYSRVKNKKKYIALNNVRWFTNFAIQKNYKAIQFSRRYSSQKYSKIENWNAINIDKTIDIPKDYDQEMAVPVSFMSIIDRSKFDILSLIINPVCNNQNKFKRILIKKV